MEQQNTQGSARIGSTGNKLHPAINHERYGLMICCRCPGTQQGLANKNAEFFAGVESNCRKVAA